jgi:DNA-binding NarL/FixJ family response regulator
MQKAMQKTSTQSRIARVLIVDDHPMLRRGLGELLAHESDMEVCGEADSYATAIEQVRDTQPDVVIMDIALKDCNGLEVIKQLKAQDDSLKVLVCSMHEETLFAERALRAGALGYINKEQATEAVVTAIRRVLGGKIYLGDRMAERLLHRVHGGQSETTENPVDALTDRELEVFELFGQGHSSSQIAERLHISTKTVDSHRQKIKRKLDLHSSNELVQHAVRWVMEASRTS